MILYRAVTSRWAGDDFGQIGTPYNIYDTNEAYGHIAAGWATLEPPSHEVYVAPGVPAGDPSLAFTTAQGAPSIPDATHPLVAATASVAAAPDEAASVTTAPEAAPTAEAPAATETPAPAAQE